MSGLERRVYGLSLACGCLLAATAGCQQGSTSPAPARAQASESSADASPAAPALQEVELGAASPSHQTGQIFLAGQPAPEDLANWKAQGVKTVVNLRKPDEIDWDEQAAVEAQGMRYVALPFQSGEELTDEIFDRVRELLGDAEQQPLVLHCGAAVRVGAVWLPYRVLDQGTPRDVALEEARQVGLRARFLIDKALDYIDRQAAE